jgi:hypothetical protein
MKTILILILSAGVTLAGTMTINTTTAQDARIAPAVGSILGLGRDATAAEVKAWVIEYIKQSVLDYERRKNIEQFVPPQFATPTPTP